MARFLIILNLILAGTAGLFSWQPQSSESPTAIPVCYTPLLPSHDMKRFALDPAFQALHPAPLPLQYEGKGQNITFKTPDGKDANGYLIKAKNKSDNWLLVYQEWWGLNDYIRRESDRYYDDLRGDVNVLALDMYDGQVTDNPQEAGKLVSSVKEERLTNIIKGGLTYAGPNAQVANVGWCFGGGLSLRSGLLGGKNTIGVVMYYGMPVQDVQQLKNLNSDVLGVFATEERISKEIIETFDSNMDKAGKQLIYKIFPGVHGFANPSNPKYDQLNAEQAYGMSIAYLKNKFNV
ncbi:dienelactone hydrolase family protein [Telluribacter sp.]|jgi:carboxymethylenebutenolidase|uniref:dienelactone hydrolase family protein n=1 Tax=Telluribacter sp. TaxID=1978767 RepID=UPI002E14534C|nr:dienelactone hydrolase family protein [Telluribacter sp.]